MKKPVENHYLEFTRKEKNGIIALLVLIALIIILPRVFVWLFPERALPLREMQEGIASLKAVTDSSEAYASADENNTFETSSYRQSKKGAYPQIDHKAALFQFDPNTISFDEWKRLGVKEKTIHTIQKYISNGGRFRTPADIKKIWGIPPGLSDQLVAYVKINGQNNEKVKMDKIYPVEDKPVRDLIIDINKADSAALEQLPGIGAKLSQRIIHFREKLGGFYKVEQVAEVFGLADSTFKKIRAKLMCENNLIRRININSVSLDELKMHPYIKFALANAIIQYRNQHGPFESPEGIKKIMLVDEAAFSKLLPYLSIGP